MALNPTGYWRNVQRCDNQVRLMKLGVFKTAVVPAVSTQSWLKSSLGPSVRMEGAVMTVNVRRPCSWAIFYELMLGPREAKKTDNEKEE